MREIDQFVLQSDLHCCLDLTCPVDDPLFQFDPTSLNDSSTSNSVINATYFSGLTTLDFKLCGVSSDFIDWSQPPPSLTSISLFGCSNINDVFMGNDSNKIRISHPLSLSSSTLTYTPYPPFHIGLQERLSGSSIAGKMLSLNIGKTSITPKGLSYLPSLVNLRDLYARHLDLKENSKV